MNRNEKRRHQREPAKYIVIKAIITPRPTSVAPTAYLRDAKG